MFGLFKKKSAEDTTTMLAVGAGLYDWDRPAGRRGHAMTAFDDDSNTIAPGVVSPVPTLTTAQSAMAKRMGITDAQYSLELARQHAQAQMNQQVQEIGMGVGRGLGGGGGVATMTSSQAQMTPGGASSQIIQTPTKVDIGGAIARDIESQGEDADAFDTNRLARTAIREVRDIDDKVFEAAGVSPKHHKENFLKVIDEIMKSL